MYLAEYTRLPADEPIAALVLSGQSPARSRLRAFLNPYSQFDWLHTKGIERRVGLPGILAGDIRIRASPAFGPWAGKPAVEGVAVDRKQSGGVVNSVGTYPN